MGKVFSKTLPILKGGLYVSSSQSSDGRYATILYLKDDQNGTTKAVFFWSSLVEVKSVSAFIDIIHEDTLVVNLQDGHGTTVHTETWKKGEYRQKNLFITSMFIASTTRFSTMRSTVMENRVVDASLLQVDDQQPELGMTSQKCDLSLLSEFLPKTNKQERALCCIVQENSQEISKSLSGLFKKYGGLLMFDNVSFRIASFLSNRAVSWMIHHSETQAATNREKDDAICVEVVSSNKCSLHKDASARQGFSICGPVSPTSELVIPFSGTQKAFRVLSFEHVSGSVFKCFFSDINGKMFSIESGL